MRVTELNISLSFMLSVPTILVRIAVCFVLLYRRKRCGYAYRRIKLTRGRYAKVDPDVFEELNKYKWHCSNHGYAARSARINGRKVCIYMHQLILSPPHGMFVDHINRDKLDNRRVNLRLATPLQNSWNRSGRIKSGRSCYKGVSWHKGKSRWHARIKIPNGRQISLGLFKDETQAAKAYDRAAKKYVGKFAYLNFPKK